MANVRFRTTSPQTPYYGLRYPFWDALDHSCSIISDHVLVWKKRSWNKYFGLHDGNGSLIGSRYILVGSGLHLELVHGLTGLGDIELVVIVVAHNGTLLFTISPESRATSGEIVFLSVTLVWPESRAVWMEIGGNNAESFQRGILALQLSWLYAIIKNDDWSSELEGHNLICFVKWWTSPFPKRQL